MQTRLLSTLVVSMAILFQGCSQGTADNRSRTSGKNANVVMAAKGIDDGDAGKGKGDDADKGKGDDADKGIGDDAGKGKGDDAGKDDDTDGDDPIVDDNDDDKDDGKGGNPSQNPGQNPSQTPQDDDDSETPVDIPPVDLPKKACVYFDPDAPEFVLKKDQFGPNLPPIDVPSHLIKGELQADQATYIGSFTVFQERKDSSNWMSKWDGRTGRIPHDYTMVVVNSVNDSCTAYVRFVQQLPRTNNGCFAQHTKIRMFDGSDRVIALINVGDMVYNPVTKTAQKVTEVRKGKEAKPMFELAFGGTTVMVTDTHPMPVRGGIKMAKDVTTSDYLFDEKGIMHRVTLAKKMPLNPEQVVVNVVLESSSADPMHHMVLADGVVSGDLFLQRQMEAASQRMTAAK